VEWSAAVSKAIVKQGPLRLMTLEDGSQTIEVLLNELPPPGDAYLADWFHASIAGRTCTFNFGKTSVRGDSLVTVLSLMLPLAQMKGLSETLVVPRERGTTFVGLLEELVKKHEGAAPPALGVQQAVTDRTKEHALAANFAVLGYNDSDATICFYRIPPNFDLRKMGADRLDRVQVIPVVRVDTSASILLEFARRVTEFAATLSKATP
jgi:hypothetical protein